jgi:glycosyltransferase involved in cell wall biosynthesis
VIKRKLQENEQLKKAVILKGKVNHCELEASYNAADFFISGSHKEGSGYALIEAMACGCIPVVTNIPSFKKITCGGIYGFLFEPGNPESLLRVLLNLKSINKEEMSASVVNHFNQSLSFKSIADNLFRICERFI